ncbi:MAG: GTPase [Candidatus Nanoarchaeia archaeon]
MALPHDVQLQIIKKRIKGKEGKAKLTEIEQIMQELPGYNQGAYGKIKQWLRDEVKKTKTRSKIKHQDWLGVKKEGDKQFVLVGCPNIGKSSLLKNLCGLQTEVANYEFTTLKPIPGIVNINNADFQIVDLPGLVEGASENVGEGKRFLGIVRTADGILLMHDLTKSIEDVKKMVNELEKSNIDMPMIIIGSKIDRSNKLEELKETFPNNKVIGLSNTTMEGINELKQAIWQSSNLIRVYAKGEPVILNKQATIRDFAIKIHRDLLKKFKHARITGPSAKFDNQQVGLDHALIDGDNVELVLER